MIKSLILVIGVIFTVATYSQKKAAINYFDQKPPGMKAEIFAPGLFSTGITEFTPAFSPDGKECYYTIIGPDRLFLIFRNYVKDKWGLPEIAPFNGTRDDADLTLSPDGKKVFFWSNRPTELGETKDDGDIWMAEKINNAWGKAIRLDTFINNKKWQIAPTTASNGNLYFASQAYSSKNSNGHLGKMDLYKCEWVNGKYGEPVNLGESINSKEMDEEPFIAPDESYIIFSSNREGTIGKQDLYISYKREDRSWTKATNMGKKVNSAEWEGVPIVSPDGKYLFFSSQRPRENEYKGPNIKYDNIWPAPAIIPEGKSDIYWIDAKIIEELRPKK